MAMAHHVFLDCAVGVGWMEDEFEFTSCVAYIVYTHIYEILEVDSRYRYHK